jgi:hypothetical protein
MKSPESSHEIGNSTDCSPGFFYIEIRMNSKTYYEYYYIKVYNIPFTSLQKCIRFRMGYKLDEDLFNKSEWVEEVLVLNPFANYSGLPVKD